MPTDGYEFWRAQLAGLKPEANDRPAAGVPADPCAGYYRDRKGRAIAFWQTADGEWHCAVSSGFVPSKDDQMEELFAACCRSAVTYEAYSNFISTGLWPESVAPLPAQQPPAADDPVNEALPPEQWLSKQLAALKREAKAWLAAINHLPQTQEEADKAANYANAFARIERDAEKARKAEKDEFLKAGRAIDLKWKGVSEDAGVAKTWAKSLPADFVAKEQKRLADEAAAENKRIQQEHDARLAAIKAEQAEQAAMLPIGVEPMPIELPKEPVFLKSPESVKVGTQGRVLSQRDQEVWAITDAKSLLHFLADRNVHTTALLDAALAEGRRLAEGGLTVPGVASEIKKVMV